MIYILILHFALGYQGSIVIEKFNTKTGCEKAGEATKTFQDKENKIFGYINYECVEIKD